MNIKKVKKLSPIKRLAYWITEREYIRLKKEAGEPRPWTDDEILATFRFCNARRMDDRVSQWLLNNWYDPHYNHKNMAVACTLARHLNIECSLKAVGFPKKWDADKVHKILKKRTDQGLQVFNAAYIIRGAYYKPKIDSIVYDTTDAVYKNPPNLDTSSMEKCVEEMQQYWAVGSFIGGQIVADMRHAIKGKWSDKYDWAPMGPGSKRGMNRLHERDPKAAMSQSKFLDELRELRDRLHSHLPLETFKRLEGIDIQNCLCEFDKYTRTLTGESKPKQFYKPYKEKK